MPLAQYILRRLVLIIPLLIGISLIAFAMSHAVPSDPVAANLGQKAMSDPRIVAALEAEWGLDRPITEQYLVYVGDMLRGDLGRSIKSRRPGLEDVRAFLPATVELATFAIIIGVSVGMALGPASATHRNTWLDHGARIVSLLGVSVPVFWWPHYARVVRSLVIGVKSQEYVEAAYSTGVPPHRVLRRTVLPNCLAPAVVLATIDLGNAILVFAGLSFLGLGPEPSTPEWGRMIADGIEYFDQWWLATFAGLAIFTVVIAFNFMGDGIRDAMDPRLRKSI